MSCADRGRVMRGPLPCHARTFSMNCATIPTTSRSALNYPEFPGGKVKGGRPCRRPPGGSRRPDRPAFFQQAPRRCMAPPCLLQSPQAQQKPPLRHIPAPPVGFHHERRLSRLSGALLRRPANRGPAPCIAAEAEIKDIHTKHRASAGNQPPLHRPETRDMPRNPLPCLAEDCPRMEISLARARAHKGDASRTGAIMPREGTFPARWGARGVTEAQSYRRLAAWRSTAIYCGLARPLEPLHVPRHA